MAKRNSTFLKEIPTRERVTQYAEYWKFVEWIATPTPLRNPQTQDQFAKENSLHRSTLSIWKRVDGFSNDVQQIIRRYSTDKMANIIASLENAIYREGKGSDVKVWLEWAAQWAPKQVIEHTGKVETVKNPKIDELVKKFEKALQEHIQEQA